MTKDEAVRDAEKWLILTCTTIHEQDHNGKDKDVLLDECSNPICKALAALAKAIEGES